MDIIPDGEQQEDSALRGVKTESLLKLSGVTAETPVQSLISN